LYGLDRAMESVQLGLTRSPEARAQLAMAHAEERLREVQTLIDAGGSEAGIQEALDGYGASISLAAAELARVAGSGEGARAEALAGLLQSALSVHSQVLAQVKEQTPEQSQVWIDQALMTSDAGRQQVESLFSGGMPGGESGAAPDGAPEGRPSRPGRETPADPPEGAGSEGQAPALEERIGNLQAHIDQAKSAVEEGDVETARAVLITYQSEVDALARELAAVAEDDVARAQALAALLDAALTIHSGILAQLQSQAPEEAQGAIEDALLASGTAQSIARQWMGEGLPGRPPGGTPSGPP
jgi:hypothetical protein